jgi:hypothetical protein
MGPFTSDRKVASGRLSYADYVSMRGIVGQRFMHDGQPPCPRFSSANSRQRETRVIPQRKGQMQSVLMQDRFRIDGHFLVHERSRNRSPPAPVFIVKYEVWVDSPQQSRGVRNRSVIDIGRHLDPGGALTRREQIDRFCQNPKVGGRNLVGYRVRVGILTVTKPHIAVIGRDDVQLQIDTLFMPLHMEPAD